MFCCCLCLMHPFVCLVPFLLTAKLPRQLCRLLHKASADQKCIGYVGSLDLQYAEGMLFWMLHTCVDLALRCAVVVCCAGTFAMTMRQVY